MITKSINTLAFSASTAHPAAEDNSLCTTGNCAKPATVVDIGTAKLKAQVKETPLYLTGITTEDLTDPKLNTFQRLALRAIAWYQKVTRKVDAKGTIESKTGICCQFHPGCSTYTAQAIKTHGLIKGGILGAKRIAACNPFRPTSKEYGLIGGVGITTAAIISFALGSVGINAFTKERQLFEDVMRAIKCGAKTEDPVKA